MEMLIGGFGMTDAVLSQIEQILQGIETRTAHTDELCGEMGCFCDRFVRVRTEIARTVERMLDAAIWDVIPELTLDDTFSEVTIAAVVDALNRGSRPALAGRGGT